MRTKSGAERNIFDFNYTPRSFCREYVDLRKNSGQLVQFMAVVLGLKRSYDDWFPARQIEGLKGICKKYGLKYKFDWIFVAKRDVSKVISGGGRLPTTKMLGSPFTERFGDIPGANVHVFLARSQKNLELSFRNGWYPLIIKNRAVHKPYIDILRFGYFLSYPDCCVDYFRRFNNHFIYNYLSEALKNTYGRPHIFCNPLLKDHTFSYIYHMPCAYDCRETVKYVNGLRDKLAGLEPGLVELTDRMLAKPFLSLGEQNAYIFEGKVEDNGIFYSDFKFIGADKMEVERLDRELARGNRVKVGADKLVIYKDNKKIADKKKPLGAFTIKFSG